MGQESRHGLVGSCASGSLTSLRSVSQGWGLSWGWPEEGFASKFRWLLAGFSSSRGCQMEASASVTHSVTSRAPPTLKGRGLHKALTGCHPRLFLRASVTGVLPHAKRTHLSSSPGVSSLCSINLRSRISTSTSVPGVTEVPGCSPGSPAPGTQFLSVCELVS